MKRVHISTALSVCLLACLGSAGTAGGQESVEYPPVSDNAALQYWQAFAMLPALDADQEKILENWATVPLDDAAANVIDQSQASLMFLRRAAKLKRCDWGFDYRDGISLYLPHLTKARTLARIAALEARRALDEGRKEVARDDAYAMMAMARQVGGDFTLVSVLVSYGIEGLVVDLMAPHVPELKASYADALAGFESLPPRPRLDHAVLCEKRLANAIVLQLKEAEKKQPGAWRPMWDNMMAPDMPESLRKIDSLAQVEALMDQFESTYDELARRVMLPPDEFDAQFPRFAERARAANPIAEIMLPAMTKVVTAERLARARTEMLLAAIAYVDGGAEKLAGIPDPFGKGPFRVKPLDRGFELSSELVHDGKPVVQRFSRDGEVNP